MALLVDESTKAEEELDKKDVTMVSLYVGQAAQIMQNYGLKESMESELINFQRDAF